MQFERALRLALVGQSSITSIAGQRIRYGEHKPEHSGLPDVFFEVSNAPSRHAYGDESQQDRTLRDITCEITVRSLQPSDVLDLTVAIAAAINSLRATEITIGSETGYPFEAVWLLDDGSDLPEDEITTAGTTQAVFRGSVVFRTLFRTAAISQDSNGGDEEGGGDGDLPPISRVSRGSFIGTGQTNETVTHNLGQRFVQMTCFRTRDGVTTPIGIPWSPTSTSTATLHLGGAVTGDQIDWLVVG